MQGNVRRACFAFFNKKISKKYGEKCCRYGQDGKPLPKDRVQKTYEIMKEFLDGWKFNEEHTIIYRYFYCSNYLSAVQFMKDIAKIDALTTNNTPSFHLTRGELLKVELYSPSLMGLSQVDFELASAINRMKFKDYELEDVEDEMNYRAELRMKRQAKTSDALQKMLAETYNSTNNKEGEGDGVKEVQGVKSGEKKMEEMKAHQ